MTTLTRPTSLPISVTPRCVFNTTLRIWEAVAFDVTVTQTRRVDEGWEGDSFWLAPQPAPITDAAMREYDAKRVVLSLEEIVRRMAAAEKFAEEMSRVDNKAFDVVTDVEGGTFQIFWSEDADHTHPSWVAVQTISELVELCESDPSIKSSLIGDESDDPEDRKAWGIPPYKNVSEYTFDEWNMFAKSWDINDTKYNYVHDGYVVSFS